MWWKIFEKKTNPDRHLLEHKASVFLPFTNISNCNSLSIDTISTSFHQCQTNQKIPQHQKKLICMYFCYQKLQKHHSPVSQKSSMDHFEAEYHFSMRISEDKLIFNQKFQNRCAHLPLVQGNSSFQTLTVEILKQSTKGAGFNKMWVVTFSRL